MDWLHQLTTRLPSLPGMFRNTASSEQMAIYVSGSAVATAIVEANSSLDEGKLGVRMQASPISQLADMPEVLPTQLANLEVNGSSSCNLVLAPELYHLVLVEKPEVAEEEVADAVRWSLQEHVDYPVEEAVIDTFDLPVSASRERPMVYVACIQQSFLRTLIDKLQNVAVKPASIDISELALRNLVWRCFPSHDQSVALLRLTANSGMISVSRGDALYLSRRISGAPKAFNDVEWEDFRDRMLLQVQRSIDYYESAMNQPHCNVLMAACTHNWSARVCDYLSEVLPIPVRTLGSLVEDEVSLRLFNPHQELVDWSQLTEDQANAIAAGLPAIGGVLRRTIHQSLEVA